ncbi:MULTISPECIES: hypothetical protein [Pseudomonas]|uniref:hypothetical protein n=1 Tax=Pseudomonas TaxID=286 RepID=UPI003003060B
MKQQPPRCPQYRPNSACKNLIQHDKVKNIAASSESEILKKTVTFFPVVVFKRNNCMAISAPELPQIAIGGALYRA